VQRDVFSQLRTDIDNFLADEYHCPATFRVFTDHTHIVAIKTTGNVYAYEAIDRLNIKAKNWRDLLTDEPFTREDIIVLQVIELALSVQISFSY